MHTLETCFFRFKEEKKGKKEGKKEKERKKEGKNKGKTFDLQRSRGLILDFNATRKYSVF